MNDNISIFQSATQLSRLRVFSLYIDLPGSIHARWINTSISQFAGHQWVTSTEAWSLGSLAANASMRIMTTGEAAKANILTVTISSLSYRQHGLFAWLEDLAVIKAEDHDKGLFIAYIGEDENHVKESEWSIKQFENISQRMNREMFWQRSPSNAVPDTFWLKTQVNSFLTSHREARKKLIVNDQQLALMGARILPALVNA